MFLNHVSSLWFKVEDKREEERKINFFGLIWLNKKREKATLFDFRGGGKNINNKLSIITLFTHFFSKTLHFLKKKIIKEKRTFYFISKYFFIYINVYKL